MDISKQKCLHFHQYLCLPITNFVFPTKEHKYLYFSTINKVLLNGEEKSIGLPVVRLSC